MCDALVALPDATARGTILFGKNSDRPVDDCQVVHVPGDDEGSAIRCSHVSLKRTWRPLKTLGCRPFWCWGYETGINEAGVIGGNTAVFTKALREPPSVPGLTGMDLLRLGLERAESASGCVETIAAMIEKYGQWGSGVPGQDHDQGSYDNAFLLVDRREAWVLETAGTRWVAQRVVAGVRSISNELSIRDRWDLMGGDPPAWARERNWWHPGGGPFDFALACADHERYARQVSHIRRMRSTALLEEGRGEITVAGVMSILRDHFEGTFLDGPQFHPFLPDFHTLCMHDSPAGFTWGNTATSFVVEMRPDDPEPPTVWVCYGPPCAGVYFPVRLGSGIPEPILRAGETGLSVQAAPSARGDAFHEESLWWRFRRLLEAMAVHPIERRPQARGVFDPIERDLQTRASECEGKGCEARNAAMEALMRHSIAKISAGIVLLESEWRIGD